MSEPLNTPTPPPEANSQIGIWPQTDHALLSEFRNSGGKRREELEAYLVQRYQPAVFQTLQQTWPEKNRQDLEDLHSGFIHHSMIGGQSIFMTADPARPLRPYLKQALTNYAVTQWRKDKSQRRGSGTRLLPLDADGVLAEAEIGSATRYRTVAELEQALNTHFDVAWAQQAFSHGLRAVRRGSPKHKKIADVLLPWIMIEEDNESLEIAATALDVSPTNVRTQLYRLRQTFRQGVRDYIRSTLPPGADEAEEMRYLCKVLAQIM